MPKQNGNGTGSAPLNKRFAISVTLVGPNCVEGGNTHRWSICDSGGHEISLTISNLPYGLEATGAVGKYLSFLLDDTYLLQCHPDLLQAIKNKLQLGKLTLVANVL